VIDFGLLLVIYTRVSIVPETDVATPLFSAHSRHLAAPAPSFGGCPGHEPTIPVFGFRVTWWELNLSSRAPPLDAVSGGDPGPGSGAGWYVHIDLVIWMAIRSALSQFVLFLTHSRESHTSVGARGFDAIGTRRILVGTPAFKPQRTRLRT